MDMAVLEEITRDKFGNEIVDQTWKELELYFGTNANNIMEYLK